MRWCGLALALVEEEETPSAALELSSTTSAYGSFWESGSCAARRERASVGVRPLELSRVSMRLSWSSGELCVRGGVGDQ